MNQPTIVTGARGPREVTSAPQRAGGPTTIPKGKRVYQSKFAGYRVQLTAPEEVKTSDGRITRKRALVAQFQQNFLMLDENKDADKILFLEDNPEFGAFNEHDFWNFESAMQSVAAAKTAQVLAILQDPAQREVIRQALEASGEEDFKLPPLDRNKVVAKPQPQA